MRRIEIILVFSFLFNAVSSGQNSRTMYFMNIPQNRFLNPAIAPVDSLYIGLPVISGLGLSLNNNFLRYSDVIIEGRTDSVFTFVHRKYDHSRFIDRLRKNNYIGFDAAIQLLGLAFKAGGGFILLDINERFSVWGAMPGSAFRLAVQGTDQDDGRSYDLSNSNADMLFFHELGIGYSRKLNGNIRAAIKGKFLIGSASLSSDVQSLNFIIEKPSFSVDAEADVDVNIPLRINYTPERKISEIDIEREETINSVLMRNRLNPGLAFDIGIVWQFNPQLSVSAALTDVGFIRWRSYFSTFRVDEQFAFESFNISRPFTGEQTFEEAGDILLDSAQNLFTINVLHNEFTTWLPPTINLGSGYDFNKVFSLGLLLQTRFAEPEIMQSLTLSANMNIKSHMSASLSYTAANNRYDNIGAGLAFRTGPFQLYMVTDRLLLKWKSFIYENDVIKVPENWNTVDLRIGLNLLFGHGKIKGPECITPYRLDVRK